MRRIASVANGVALLLVLTGYAWFGSGQTFEFRRVPWTESYYASLAEGFLRGQLSMAHVPDRWLAQIPDPYVMEQRGGISYLWDATYFEGRYFLYFTPLPALVLHIPFRLLSGGYPSDDLAVTLFAAAAFLISVAVAARALRGTRTFLPFWLWILVLGLGNTIPVVIAEVRVYQVAGAFGMMCGALWAWTLLRFFEAPGRPRAFWMGLALALTIAARLNLLVLVAVTAVALLIVSRRDFWRLAAAVVVPLLFVGCLYAVYNAMRFHSPFETGMTYQLTTTPMRDQVPCSLCGWKDAGRFVNHAWHYVFWSPTVDHGFPFVKLQYNRLDKATTFPARSEQVGGIAPIVPLTLVALVIAAILAWPVPSDTTARVGLLLTAAAWIVLLSLSTCSWVTARYGLDFSALMMTGTVLVTESGLARLSGAGLRSGPLRWLCVALAVYSIVLGVLLGVSGYARRDGAPARAYAVMERQPVSL